METPSVSVVVPTYNRLNYLKNCLESLRQQDFGNFEIIIVDDGSDSEVREYLEKIKSEKMKVIFNEKNLGASNSRNAGAKLSRNEIIAFIDDDCRAQKNWLRELLKKFENEKTGFVFGKTFYVSQNYQGHFPERLVGNANGQWPGAGNIAYRKEVFEKCGGFDQKFAYYTNEDTEMALRAMAAGFSYKRSAGAIVNHQKMFWKAATLWKSARNVSVWPSLKKKYPKIYKEFGAQILFGFIISPIDYMYILLFPIFFPIFLIRYWYYGGRDLGIFWAKWPVWLIIKRYYIYQEAWNNKILML